MAVQFKFRSAVEFNSVDVEGPFISVRDLKRKIAEHKNLNNCKDFDLLITDAQSGKEYNDESISVPTNTSVIIKRVPAARPKSAVVLPDVESLIKASSSKNTDKDDIWKSPSLPNADVDGFGDFGVDLYTDPGPCLPETCMNESDMVGMVSKEDLDKDRQRESQGPSSGSQMFEAVDSSRALARGHYGGRSPINGNATYDSKRAKLPDRLVNAMRSDDKTLPKKLEAFLPTMPNSELPSELRCSLCQEIFQGAVMIPCCQFSFCHECIRQVLVEKGKCPQCSSTKFKIDELLPNIALRQAIERFLESQVTISTAEDCAAKHAPDGESGIQAKAAASQALSHRQGLSEAKKSILDNGEGVTVSKAPRSFSHKDEGITMEFQANKGKKRRKAFPLSATDGVANFMASGKLKKGGRCCYVCGSPEHLARDCPDNSSTYLQHGMFHAGGPIYPGNVPAYGPNAYWHGTSVPHVRPFPNMYGPTPPPLSFETPMMPVAPYAIPPYMPSIYSGVPLHCGFMRMGSVGPSLVTPSERPLSREEFMQLQDNERRRRLLQEQQDRERIQEKANSMQGDSRVHCSESQKHWYDQRKLSEDEHYNPYITHELDRDSVRNYSDESYYQKSRSGKHMRKHSQEKYIDSNACHRQDSISDDSDYQKGRIVRHTQKYPREKYIDSNACQGQDTVSNESDCQKGQKWHTGRCSQEKHADSYACQRQESMCEDEDNLSYDRRGNSLHSEREHRYSKSPKYSGRNHSRHYLEDSVERSTSGLEVGKPRKTCQTVHGELGYLNYSKQSGSKKYSERKIIYRKSGSPCNSHLSHHGSKIDVSKDLKRTRYHKKNTKKHGNSEHTEENDGDSLCRYDSAEEENLERNVQHEKYRSNHRKKWRHLTGEYDLYFSSEESKRRKKCRNDQRNSLDKTRDSETNVIDESELHTSRHRKHKSKSHSKPTTSVLPPIEESRWQMDAGLDTDNEDVYYMYHKRDKHDHSHRKKEN